MDTPILIDIPCDQIELMFNINCICISLPFAEGEEYFRLGADVLDGWGPGADLPAEDVVEDLYGVLLPLEVDSVHVAEQEEQQPRVVHLLGCNSIDIQDLG